ncbi:APC family permease [Streptomyces sp. NPDC006527]|uniref:APC family permease n=1 Tax=Streptomyces sp. NPDC006527 TaxID=3364749 RepID=UPI0036964017
MSHRVSGTSSTPPTGSALDTAIARSFSVREPALAASPLRALGRRQLSGAEVLAQSVATTAPAAGMIGLPVAMLQRSSPADGFVAIVVATAVTVLIALCVSQFTRRMAAAGGLYTFAAKGAGRRTALTVGVALAVKYCGSAAVTLYLGGQQLVVVLGRFGVDATGPAGTLAVYGLVAAAILMVVFRGARFAAIAILAVELCSLALIGFLLVLDDGGGPPPDIDPSATPHTVPLLTLWATFALAGFESAAFLGPEARRPLVTVTRTVLWTPVICGGLCIVATWAVWSGRGTTLISAYLHGSAAGVAPGLVTAVQVAVMCSWFASAMASFNASSHLLYTMGVEKVLPSPFRLVHRRFRTPYGALTAVATLVTGACLTMALARPETSAPVAALRPTVQGSLLLAYVLVAIACLRFLRRINELTPFVRVAVILASTAGAALLGHLLYYSVTAYDAVVFSALCAIGVSGIAAVFLLRRFRPASLSALGVFDSAESNDVLPGSASYGTNERGLPALVRKR